MKLKAFIMAATYAVIFLSTGILYAGNGDLIVNGNLGVGTEITGNAKVNGNIQITGTGNGIIFPDGTTQPTALRRFR